MKIRAFGVLVRMVHHSNKLGQRSALFFCALILTFSLFEPGASQVLAVAAANKTFKTDYKLKPLNSEKSEVTAGLNENTGGPLERSKVDNPRGHLFEETDKRTPFTSTYINNDGTRSLEYSTTQQNYLDGKVWKKINNTLSPVEKKAPTASFWQSIIGTEPKAPASDTFMGKAGVLSAEIKPLSGGITIHAENKTITMKPIGAKNVKPESRSDSSIVYKDAWPGVDIEYELRGEEVKEIIVLKDKKAQSAFHFSIDGGKVIPHPTRSGELAVEGLPDNFSFSALTLDVNGRGVISEQRVSQMPTKNGSGIDVAVDSDWLKSQPASAFPMRIDPSFVRDATAYWMYKSDGYSCGTNCYANIGTLYDNGWKAWRSYIQFPYNDLAGKRVLNANMHGYFKAGIGGDTNGRGIAMGRANCLGYWCQGTQVGWTGAATDFDINFTGGLQQAVDSGDMGAVWSFWGEEGAYKTYKPYYNLQASVVYDTPTPVATPIDPADKQVMVDTVPTLKVNTVTDADGDRVQYYFRVSTNPDAESGAVINSGWIDTPQWTVPDGILQDGTTYYWHVYTLGVTQTNPNWVRSFKVDLRIGKDSTQSYDTVGPVGIDLATGNATLSAGTHIMSALGGDMGLSLTYNTPNRAKKGLKAEYWNVPANYNFANGAPTGTPSVQRRDQNIDFDWGTGSPANGVIGSDWYYARWTGQFVAPATGTYNFGGSNDDNLKVIVNNQEQYNQGCFTSSNAVCYNATKSITLTAGQIVPIRVEYMDATSLGYARLRVRGPVTEQTVPRDWLYTEVANEPQSYGLTGRYYTDTGDRNIDTAATDPSRLMMVRQDTNFNLQFGLDGPARGLRTDNFMARWTGYIAVPVNGSYKFGMVGDDGARIKVKNGSSWTTLLDSWNYTNGDYRWGSAVVLPANTPVPVTIDYNEVGGAASFALKMQDATGNPTDVPITWLTPNANVLPDQWKLGIDASGSVAYERIRATTNSVILEDSTGSTHEYTYTSGGYKPPVNEDGTLSKNADNTYTFIDTDGRTYIFDTNGQLVSLTSPTDDRQPANLKYTYAGDPSRLIKIEDGVTSARYATVYYKGVNEENNICDKNGTNNPSGLFGLSSSFADAPVGRLCAFKTSDGDITNFYYDTNGNLVRVVAPGGQITDYAYDSFGRIQTIRDSLAADAIAAGVRAADDSVTTQLFYDSLGRIVSVKAPAAQNGGVRLEHTLAYSPSATDMHVTNASEPNGFSKRIRYDSLLRTTSETDLTGKTVQSEWDPLKDLQLSSTDTTGLKSTTIYDNEDRPIESYGPAPAGWYETIGVNARKPLAAYTNQIPHTSSRYDEGIKGFSTSWYNLKSANMTLFGAPKVNQLGYASPESASNPASTRFDYRNYTLPMTPDTSINGVDGYGIRATGKITLPAGGIYIFKAFADDSIRITVNDTVLINNWGTKTEGTVQNTYTGLFPATVGKTYRISIEYGHVGTPGAFDVWLAGPGIGDTSGTGLGTRDWSGYLSPGFNLATSTTAYDNQLGNVTSTTQYTNPAYGTVGSTTLDPTGLNYQSQATYEAPGTGFLRQTSKTLPGGARTTYQHYAASDTADNPCTTEVEAYHQAGRPKGKIEPDPDGVGPQSGRSSETIYDETGRVVATRYNSDPWTCTSYDTRGRITQTVMPTVEGRSGRTITNNYAVGGNPLVASTSDESGTITTEINLLGQTVKYTDAKGNVTTNTYDNFGKLTSRTSPIGTESYEYDNYDRPTKQKLDGVTFATIAYDEFSRIQSVQYPSGISLQPAVRDALGRVSKVTYSAGGQEVSDSISRSVSGLILSGIENGTSKSYTYDKADRLLSATIGSNTFSYSFGAQDSTCNTLPGNNPNAAKDSNRTSYTVNGQTITYCYDMADRLLTSSDARFGSVQYDSHGNTTSLGDATHKTEFAYDANDRNTSMKETTASGTRETTYQRDVTDRIMRRTYKVDGAAKDNSYYGFTGSSDSPSFLKDGNGTVTQKYLNLAGGVRVTIKPQSTSAGATTYSLTNMHGDVMATVNADGTPTIVAPTGPFGERTSGHIAPVNAAEGTSNDYLGSHRKASETDYLIQPVQMGARVYIPELGRFLQVDPVEGGTPNNYVYPTDPVNQLDVNGKFSLALSLPWVMVAARAAAAVVSAVVAVAASPVVMTSAVVGLGAIAITKAYVDARQQVSTQTKKQDNRCITYLPVSPPKFVAPTAPQSIQKNAALQFSASNLGLGRRPGGPIMGVGTSYPISDPRYPASGGWQKDSLWYPGSDFEVHYMVSDKLCMYDDLKTTKSFPHARKF